MPAPRVAATDAFGGKPKPFQRAVLAQCLYTILRASRSVPTIARQPWRDGQLVKPNEKDEEGRQSEGLF